MRIFSLMLGSLWLSILPTIAPAQASPLHKGSVYFYWGYNRAGYGWSDIHFKGGSYDLTVRHAKATDRPVEFDAETYFSPSTLSIPQYNYRVGWFFHDRWSISLGLDHMKYVLVQGQQVKVDITFNDESINGEIGEDGTSEVILSPEFLKYEHTDGLNLLSLDVDHFDPLWNTNDKKHALHVFEGVFAGPVIPRTDVRLFGEGINNKFHLAGYGVGAQVGLHLSLFRRGFLRFTGKAGMIDLPSVLTTGRSDARASQHFWFWQGAAVLGVQFNVGSKNKQ